jgi:glycine cleavage system H protein
MNPFTYTNIFDTKGIEYLVVIGFLLLLIPVWRWLNLPVKEKNTAGALSGALSLSMLRIPRGLLFSANHTWSHLEKSGVARVGMDDLLLHLTGGVEVKFLKKQEEQIAKGEPVAMVLQEGKKLLIASPLTGRVVKTHDALLDEPSELKEHPYESWLFAIEPDQWQEETRAYHLADEAVEWTGRELDRFRDFLAEHAGSGMHPKIVMQAGGELIDHPLQELGQEVWDRFQFIFLDKPL